MSEHPTPTKWTHQVVRAVVVILMVAVGARVAWAALAPLVPGLVMAVALFAIYAFALGKRRH